MGLFDAIKRTFNIGGCTIAIETDVSAHRQGDTITGRVALQGGEYPQEARSLDITLVEFWTESRGTGKNRRTVTVTENADAAVLESPCPIGANEERVFPFSLTLPLAARFSTPGESTGWRLEASLDIPGAVDPTMRLDLEVGPATALIELVRLWSEVLQWRENPDKRDWDRHNRSTCFRFLPPAALEGDFDHLDMACVPDEDGDWQVAFCFDLQEVSFFDYLKALINIDKAEHCVCIPGAALSGDDTARLTCAKELALLMQDIVAKRNGSSGKR